MPPPPDRPPEPSALHRAFTVNGPLDWGVSQLSAADIARLHGARATRKSLRLLEQAAAVEGRISADFVASLPDTASPYHLARRVKSPESLARKIRDWEDFDRRFPIDDVLRYTVLTEESDDLVAAARHTVDELDGRGWRVKYAMHSYTEGSRYKGIHAYLTPPGIARAEVQFHSVASAKIKDLTTVWYQIERDATATLEAREAARQQCVELSATIRSPSGISELTTLGGMRVAVNNYSDSRAPARPREVGLPGNTQQPQHSIALDKNDGIAR